MGNLKIPPSCLISLKRGNAVMPSTRSLIHRSKPSSTATLLVVLASGLQIEVRQRISQDFQLKIGDVSDAINPAGNQFLPNVYH